MKKNQKKIPAFLAAIGILIVVFLIAFFSTDLIMKLLVGHRNEVDVPNIINMDYDVARKKCGDLKLYVKKIDTISDENIEKGKIISQKPHPAITTKKHRTIEVVVSSGPQHVRIPFLENLTILQARLRLSNVGLQLGEKIYRYSEEVQKDKVIYSRPMADEMVPKSSEVDIIVSLGKYRSSNQSQDKWKQLLEE